MSAPVNLATVHHEGGGAPRDDLAAPGTKGYSYGIGLTRWTFFRTPWESFATLNFNHVSLDVLFSGDRDIYPVAAHDYVMLDEIAADARRRGFIVDTPFVRPHRESPGSTTICPGNKAAYPDPPRFPFGDPLAWLSIVTGLHKGTPPMPPTVAPEFFPPLVIVSSCLFHVPGTAATVANAMLDASGAVFCDPPESYQGGANGKPYAVGRTFARITPRPGGGYTLTDTVNEHYDYPTS